MPARSAFSRQVSLGDERAARFRGDFPSRLILPKSLCHFQHNTNWQILLVRLMD